MGNECCTPHQEQQYPATQKPKDSLPVQNSQAQISLIQSAIVKLTFHSLSASNSKVEADGTLISDNLVLTSAKNVYDRQAGSQIGKATYKVYLMSKKNSNDFYQVEDWRYLESFKNSSKVKGRIFDYALIKLKKNAQRPITIKKYLDVSLPCQCLLSQDLKNRYKLSQMSGLKSQFTGERPINNQKMKDLRQSLYESYQQQAESESSGILIKNKGQIVPYFSGHPITADNKIIAIHLEGDSNQESFERFITVNLIDQLKKWSQQLKCSFNFQQENLCYHLRDNMQVLKKETEQAAKGLERLGKGYYDQENYTVALDKYLKSLAIYEKLKVQNSNDLVKVLFGIGKIYHEQGNYVKAHDHYTKSLVFQKKMKGGQSQEAAIILDKIAEVYILQQVYLESIKTYTESLRIKQKVYGKESLKAADTLLKIGIIYRTQEKYPKAQEFLLQALEITQKIKGKHSIQAAQILYNIGNVSYRRKQYTQSVEIYKEALSIFARLDQKPRNYAYSQFNLGNTYCKLKEYKLAAQSFQDSIFSFKREKMETDITKSAMKLAKCLKILKQIKRLNQVIAQYKIDPQLL